MAAEKGLKRPYTEALEELKRLVGSSYETAMSLSTYDAVEHALTVHRAGVNYLLSQWKEKIESELLGQAPLTGQRRREKRYRAGLPYILDAISKNESPNKLAREYAEYKRTALYGYKKKIDSDEWVKKRSKWVDAETGKRVEELLKRRGKRRR